LKHFNGNGGSVINLSSLVSTLAPPNAAVYSATKGAVDTITASLAKELGPRRIRVNAVRPGLVETEGTVTSGFAQGDFHDQYVKNAPLGRIGKPQDIASATSFLASDDALWITGETLLVSGGHR
jgi:3-oxoacyl-[acyl-carrier protein] reductase